MGDKTTGIASIALSREVVVSSLKVSMVVGTILAFINHGAELLQMTVTGASILQISLTYLVPYCVATYSSTNAIRRRQ
jgi:hypothetical protein